MIMKIEHGIQYILHCFASTFDMNLMKLDIHSGLIAEMLTVNPMFRSTAKEVLIGA